ncbi:MAG: AraC family transcriptional regulator ligand-binding domain-containing protein [Pseudomonadales bacterium]
MREDRNLEEAGFHIAGELARYVQYLGSEGVDSNELLERSGISPDLLKTPDALIPAHQAYRFGEQACQVVETDRLGLAVAMQTDLAEVSGLGGPLLKARTVWEYVLIACAVASGQSCAVRFSVTEGRNGLLRVSFCRRVPPGFGSHQVDLETAALTIKRWREALGPEWRPHIINFAFPAARPLNDIELFASSQITSGGSTSWFEFPLADGRSIFPRASQASLAQPLVGAADALRPEAFADRVKLQIAASFPSGSPKIETVAASLDLSTRSLQRALQDKAADFRSLVLEARIDRACAWLADTDKPVDEIAFDLGYRDPANFSRAFRRRLGIPPSKFRAAHRQLEVA